MSPSVLESTKSVEDGCANQFGLSYKIELERNGKTSMVDSRSQFWNGDRIRFHVKPNIDGYMYISLANANGDSQMLFPFAGKDELNRVYKGVDVVIPRNGVLTFDQKPGLEALTLVLSPRPLNGDYKKEERRVVVRPKAGVLALPEGCALQFPDSVARLKEAEISSTFRNTINTHDGKYSPKPSADAQSATVTSTNLEKPLIVDLFLRHGKLTEAQRSPTAAPPVLPSEITSALDKDSQPANVNTPIADKWAVVVGISKFKLPALNLRFPDKDAKDMADFLINKAHFSPDHVKVLTDEHATRSAVLGELGAHWLAKNAHPDDLVFIYMATHGAADELNPSHKNYIVTYDTNPFKLPGTAIELDSLSRDVVNKLQSKRVVLVLDTCYAGAVMPGAKAAWGDSTNFDIEKFMQGTGHLVISSASRSETAHDSIRYENGIFTRQLLDGLQSFPTLSDAFRFAKTRVEEESIADFGKQQTPMMKDSDWKGTQLRLTVPPFAARKPLE